jgi:hypothetical protein
MKKIISFSIKEDNSKIHQEGQKKRMGFGTKIEKVASTKFKNYEVQVVIEPKCLK